MITPPEIERLRDLNSPQADAIIDTCRPRVVVVSKAPYQQLVGPSDPAQLLTYRFSDKLGGSGLLPGDVVRGEVFGTFVNSASTNHDVYVLAGTKRIAQIVYTQTDLFSSVVSWRARFVLRFQGGENQTINSPAKKSDTPVQCYLAIDVGDPSSGLYSVSQALAAAYVTVTDPLLDSTVNLAQPLSVTLQTAMPADSTLVIYGGAMEGL